MSGSHGWTAPRRVHIFTARKRSLGQGNIFTPVCHSVHRGDVRGWSRGGMRGCSGGVHGCSGGMRGFSGGAYVVLFGGHAWFYSGGGMRGFIQGQTWFYLGGHAWFYSGGVCGFIQGGMRGFIRGVCMVLFGGVHGFIRGACMVFPGGCACFVFSFFGYNEIRSMSGRYASYWNAFLLSVFSN